MTVAKIVTTWSPRRPDFGRLDASCGGAPEETLEALIDAVMTTIEVHHENTLAAHAYQAIIDHYSKDGKRSAT